MIIPSMDKRTNIILVALILLINGLLIYGTSTLISMNVLSILSKNNDFHKKLISLGAMIHAASPIGALVFYTLVFHFTVQIFGYAGKTSSFLLKWGLFFSVILFTNLISLLILYLNPDVFSTNELSVENVYSDYSEHYFCLR